MRPIPEDRPLTVQECTLVRWLLEHGNPEALAFLHQLAKARVISRCPCGCASIDFAIAGAMAPAEAGMQILADCAWQPANEAHCGVFVFACGGQLAGLEVWSADGMDSVSSLPTVEQLRPWHGAESGRQENY